MNLFSNEPLKEYISSSTPKKKRKTIESYFFTVLLGLFITGLLFGGTKYIGMVISGTNADTVKIERAFDTSDSLMLNLSGNVTSIRISGLIIGNGTARIYANKILVLESTTIEKKGANLITGMVVGDFADPGNNETDDEAQPDIQSESPTEEVTAADAKTPEVGVQQSQDGDENNTRMNNITSDQLLILDEVNIIETYEENISAEINLTQPTQENNLTNRTEIRLENASMIILPENQSATNGTNFNLTDDFDEEILINETSAENISVTDTLENISFENNATVNLTIIIENITSNESVIANQTNVTLIINQSVSTNATENITQSENITADMIPEEIIRFENHCEDSCVLNLPGRDIILSIELDGDARLNLTSLTYTYIEAVPENLSVEPQNLSINQSLIDSAIIKSEYSDVEINKPVKWTRMINASIVNITTLPKDSFNISSDAGFKVRVKEDEYDAQKFNEIALSRSIDRELARLPKIIEEKDVGKTFEKITSLSARLSKLDTPNIEIDSSLAVEFSEKDIVELDYYVDGPTTEEVQINSQTKRITVSSDVHYENVIAYTDIPEAKKESIQLYWLKDIGKELFNDVEYIDTNKNGLIDKLQWIIPHLSNQTFEISIIVLNPYTYLRDGETWVVAFNATGIGNLTISSPNAGWTEFLKDDIETFDEMRFLNLSCGGTELLSSLKLVGVDNNTYDYTDLLSNNTIDIKKLFLPDYECNDTGYLSNYMIEAGYATLLFEFSNQNATVTDYAYDPVASYSIADDADDGHEYPQNTWQSTGSWFGHYSTSDEWMVTRFRNIKIPQGATITRALLNVTADSGEGGSYSVYVKVRAQNADSGGLPGASNLPSTWTLTGNGTDFDIDYPSEWSSGQKHSIDITNVIQEIVNRPGWSINNNISIVFENDGSTGDHDIEIFDYPTNAATLDIEISNTIPTHETPYITPTYPNITSNLTCNWNSVQDADGDAVVNITNWYINNVSTTVLYMPFEGNGNEDYIATDYSGHGNNGNVSKDYLSDWQEAASSCYGSLTKDETYNANTMTIGGITFDKGLGCHAQTGTWASYVNYNLSGGASRFIATIGIDDECDGSATSSNATFRVLGDGSVLYTSGWLGRDSAPLNLNISIAGINNLSLQIDEADGSNNCDHSEWANAYVISSSKWNRTGGKVGGGYYFEKNDYIAVAHDESLNLSNDLTIEFWVKPKQASLSGFVVSKMDTGNDDGYSIMLWGGKINAMLNGDWDKVADTALNGNQWYHVAWTKAGTASKIYLNGNLDGTWADAPNTVLPNTEALDIGRHPTGYYFNGSIDEVKIYNISLSQEQIIADYQAGLAGRSNNLVVQEELSENEAWICSVTPNDGYSDGITKNSSSVFIIPNSLPTQSEPFITPTYPNMTSNLACNWNNTFDMEGDAVQNITTWFKNNASTAIVYLPFEGGSSSSFTKDYSGLGNSGAVTGATWSSSGGKVGGAYSFDGNDYIDLGELNSSTSSNKLSVEAWVYVTNFSGSSNTGSIVSKYSWDGSYTRSWDFNVGNETTQNESCFTVFHVGDWSYVSGVCTDHLATNTWLYLVGTFDGNSINIYVNGILNDSNTVDGTEIHDTGYSVRIGSTPDDAYFFKGYIDEVKIYNYSLSAQQILANYMAGSSGKNANLIVRQETAENDNWYCSVTPNDGYNDGITKNSTAAIIFTSNPPTQDTPYITPSPSGFNSNLTCNWNNSVDIDNDPFTNITVWYKNNIPTARLYLPFEGNDMDEDISTNDYSGYGSIGYVDDGNASSPDGSTGPIWSRTGGKVGGAYTFDGYDDSIILASSPQFDITGNQLTLMAWVKYQGTESGMIFSHSGWWNGYRFGVEPDGNYAWLQINGSAGYSLDSATNSIQPNSWYHIAAVYNGSKMMFYINGVKDSNELAKSNNLDSAPDDDVNIGMAGDCTGASWCEPFNGSIDEVRIFNYSLSAAQIKRIYEEESQGKNTQVLVADETTLGEQWFCSVTPNDGFMDGTTKNSSVATIINVPPAQNAPYITPYVPNITSNLTCNWNNVNDADYESVVNITNWYKNNKSTTLLYMPFEGGSISGTPGSNGAAKDYSGFENNGTVINATWNRTGGIVGGSYEFNGQNTYITLPAISLGGNSGTIEGWIKFRATSSASSQYIIGRDYGSVALGVTNDGGFRALFMQNWNWCANYTRALNPGSWYYIVGTIDGTNQYIYVNGTLDTTCPNTASWSSENSQWAISSNDGTWSEDQFVNGTIDEVKLYNSSLTAQQIRANYQAGLANRPSNIIVSDETSTYDQWLCSVTPNDGTQDGTTLNSSAVTIFPYGLVNITAIECQINSSVWRSCSSALWNDTITQVKVNCSGTNGIKYATYNLTNVPDAATHFNASNATSSSANSWTYDNPDIKISDSGEFTMTVSCYDGVFLQINSTSWAVPWGNISSVWITPTSSLNMSQNQTGTFTSYMQCTGGECGNVTVTIDPTTELIGDPSYYTIKVNNSYSIKLADSVQYAGSEWYDLETDPGQSSDNIPSYGLFSWWTSFPGGWADLSYSTVYSARILENSSARIVIERKHYNVSQYNSTDRLTFYPTGQLYFYENITSLYSNIDYFELPFAYLSSPFNSNWTIDNSLEYILRQQSGVANSPTYLIIADRTYSGTIQGDGVTDREWWTNSADYNLASGQSAKRTIAYALKPNAMTQSEAIARRNDYRNPATTTNGNLTIITGSKVTTDELDYNTDGYAEGEGAYVFMVNRTAASNNSLIFNITGATYTRYSPVFKITNYSANSLPMVTFKNASGTFILVSGVDYNIAFQNRSNATDTVIVQYLRNIGSNVQFNISSFIAPKGAISTLPGAVPFWTSTSNPQVCMNMKPGYSCTTTWSVNATGVPGDYYTFYVIYNASNYSGYVRGNETSRFIVTIDGGSSPSVSAISLVPSIANTSSDLGCYATILSRYNSSLTVEYWWYNNSVLKVSGNATAIPNNTNSLISTLGRGNTTRSELWNCTIRAHDDFFYTGYNSTSLNITNEVPTQNSPTISPTSPNITSNLTCNWNNVQDLDGDAVVNITNWYKNNVSTTVLYMPFEGVNGNEANNATDYSGYGNNGTVFGATWNRTGGKVGGGYLFNGINDYISVGEPQWDGIWMNHTITAWIKWTGKGLTANDTIISKGGGQPAGFHYVIWRAGGGLGNVKFYMNSLERTATTTLTPGDGLWKFMAVSLNNNNVTFYLNGVKDGSYSISDGGNNNFKLGIGYKDATTPADYFNGTIDEVKIYNYSLSAEQIQAEYQAGLAGKSSNILVRNETSYNDNWLCSVTPNDGYVDGQAKNSSAVTIGQANNAPTITAFTLIPAIANTSSNLECNATATDDLNTTFNVEYWWYNLTTFMLGGNKTVASNTNTVISILGAGNTTRFELWNCTVRAFDGTSYSGFNSSSINISNEVPTHDTPTITPVLPNTTSNLTCNWNNVLDSDSDAVVNITNWYKNNVSTTVLYMPFEGNGNEANNATDYSGYGNNGTVLGATWNRTGGKVGGAYVFDGINDNIIINYTPKFNTTNAITIMSWVKIAKVLPGGDWDFLIDKRNSYSYLQDESSSEIQAYIETTGGNKWCTFSDNNNLNLDTWYHLTMTYDSISGNMKAYKNGILNNTCSHSGTIIITTSPIKIGSEDGSYFNGSIDEVKIYNYSLSPEQIWADYQAGLAGRTSNVIVRNETSLNDNWICSVTPNDGYNDGQTKNSSAVTIAYTNIAPINWFSNITANQNLLYANSTLMGWCNATDLEGDTVSYKPVWYLNGQYNNSANNFTWNYQENSSETFCQTLYGNCYDFFDGNWSSYGGAEYYYMNYTIPPYASPDSRWMVKDSSQTYNITIAASCLGQNKLQLRTYMQEGFNNWTCWDGNNWKELNWSNHCCEVFEEAVWWKVISFDGVSYQQGISANVKNISSSLLSKGQNWTLECTANDGVYDSNSLNSSQISIVNTPPIHDTPTITPTLPNTTSNLTCNWNNVQDLDGDAVVNITNWYKNNVSTTVLYMPFEGVNGNEANNATDYSGYGNNGTVFGATWNRTGGKIGGAYDFDGNDDYIKIPASTSINFKDKANFSIEAWVKPDSFGENISGRIFQKGNSYLLTQRVNASIFSSDFEGSDSNLCNGGDGWTTGLCDSGNTAVGNEQTIVYSGLYAAKFTTTGTADTARVAKSLTTGYQTLYIRFYFKLDYEDLSSFGQLTLLHLQDSVAWQDIQIGIKDNGDGTYDLGTSDANLVEYDDDAAEHLLLDTWYSIETKIYRHPTAGTIDVWLDGVNVASDTGLDTGDNNIDYIWLGIDYANSNNNQVVIDDLVIDDQYIGPTQNVTLSCNVDLATTDANANTTTTISVNRWGLVACNYNNLTKNVSIYINGTEAAYSNRQQGSGALSDDSSSDMYVGSNNGVFAYDGTIDEFRIYNYTLSQNQIYQDYLAGLANRTSNILVFNEITLNDQWLCSVTPNDGYADGQTKNSTTVTITQANNAPSISAFALKPTIANTSSNIQCNATISDAEQSTVTVEYWWYNSSVFVLGGNKTGVAVNSNIIISTLGNGNTTKGETWNCTIRAFDGELYSSYNSTAITIQNAPPSTPALVSPTNGNLTYHDRTPEFSWTSTDADGDPINYTINITFSSTLSCGPDIWKNLTANSYTGAFDYCTDQVVYWQVIASDPYSSSSWSNLSNFTIESFLSINLTTRSIDFGILHLMDERNTASGYAPIVIENIGNIFVNIARIGANGSLWQSLGLDTEYFQFKADNLSTHPDSFNYTNSTTEWTNVTSVQTANATILRDLNYSDDHNAAEIDIKVVVPLEEPPGSRSVTLYIMGEQS